MIQTTEEKRLSLLLTLQSALYQMDDLSHTDEIRRIKLNELNK